MLYLLSGLHIPLQLLARGGGGGSDSDGGDILVLIGYVPMHALGALFRRKRAAHIGSFIVWPVAVLYGLLLIVIFRGWGFFMAVGSVFGAGAGLYGWFGKLRRNKKAQLSLTKAQLNDGAWNEAQLKEYVQKVFKRFQYDWGRYDLSSIQKYTTTDYYKHVWLMMLALQQSRRQNLVENPEITMMEIQEVVDAADNTSDSFVMGIEAKANDSLIDTRDNNRLFSDSSSFVEYWHFKRSGNTWLLAGIKQATENRLMVSDEVEAFARSQNMFFSPDWGWLLLPREGKLFGKASFGKSDINNHCIGIYKNVLVQIYSFIPTTQAPNQQYLIAQAQLPKSYGSIIVRKKKLFQPFLARGLQKIQTEWTQFNKKYQVYASSGEGATSFELLHPSFMEFLEKQPFEVNLEVVDNMVYFFSPQQKLKPENYPVMLSIVHEAFKQMKM